jgi:hypothetical protein
MAEGTVARPPMRRMTTAEYYEWLLKEHLRESAAKRGIEIVDEADRAHPRLVAERGSAEVVPLVKGECDVGQGTKRS